MELILSFCIATFNRREKIKKLVRHILQCPDRQFEVVVADDCSQDGTYEALQELKDSRLRLFQNKERKGANYNWYYALEKGQGKYIFQVLDRDWIKISEIKRLIQILKELNVGFGYAGLAIVSQYEKNGNRKGYTRYLYGLEALKKFACVPTHPTGVFFAKNEWKKVKIREKIFMEKKWGVYPHGYVFAILGQFKDGAMIHVDICNKKLATGGSLGKSRYYSAQEKKDFWWLPESRLKELMIETCVIKHLKIKDEWKSELITDRFKDQLYLATKEYKNIASDPQNARHYGIEVYDPGKLELAVIAVSFWCLYRKWLENINNR